MGKYTEAKKLKAQAHELMRRTPAAESPHTITTMTHVQEAQEIQALDAGSNVPDQENLQPTEVALNHPIQAVLPETTMTPEKKGMHFGNCSFNPSDAFILSPFFFQTYKESFKFQIQNSTFTS